MSWRLRIRLRQNCSPGYEGSSILNNASGFRKVYIAAGYTDLRRGIDGLASIVKFNFQLDPYEKDILFLFCGRRSDRIKGLVWEGRRIPSPLQKAGAWRFQLAPYKRRGAGDHAGTIPGADAGAGDRIQAPDPGSAARRSPVIHCAKRRNLKIFSGPPSQIQWKLSTSGFHTIHSLKSTPQRSAAVWISTLKN